MKIRKNKKCQGALSDWLFWGLFIIMTGMVVLIIFAIGDYFISQAAEIPPNVEELTLISRFYNSGDCFAYQDNVGRVHTKKIDLNKFNQETMNQCFSTNDAKYAFSLSLEVPSIEIDVDSIKTPNWEEGYSQKEITENIVVFYNNEFYNGKLKIKIKNV